MKWKVNLSLMGKEWAWLAIRHQCEPCTTGNLEHDRACAEEYMRKTGTPPQWWEEDRHGAIYHPFGHYPRRYTRPFKPA